jgi:SAM-dependent methyltransferase
VQDAVRHFEVGYGFTDTGGRLRRYLEDLWAPAGRVEIRRCERCAFGFAWPHRAGDAEFYNLVTDGSPEYPQERWEFERATVALRGAADGGLRVVEAGAGDGAFLALLRDRLGGALEATALEYDDGALAALRRRGFEARRGSLQDLAEDPEQQGRFDAVCMFQTLEHMDDERAVREALVALVRVGGHVFASVPNGVAIDAQERLTGFWDMPPNHVGRWSRAAVEAWVAPTPLTLAEDDLEPAGAEQRVAAYAGQRLMADRYRRRSLPALAERARHPIAIDVLTRRRRRRYEQAARDLAPELPPPTYWFHLVRES